MSHRTCCPERETPLDYGVECPYCSGTGNNAPEHFKVVIDGIASGMAFPEDRCDEFNGTYYLKSGGCVWLCNYGYEWFPDYIEPDSYITYLGMQVEGSPFPIAIWVYLIVAYTGLPPTPYSCAAMWRKDLGAAPDCLELDGEPIPLLLEDCSSPGFGGTPPKICDFSSATVTVTSWPYSSPTCEDAEQEEHGVDCAGCEDDPDYTPLNVRVFFYAADADADCEDFNGWYNLTQDGTNPCLWIYSGEPVISDVVTTMTVELTSDATYSYLDIEFNGFYGTQTYRKNVSSLAAWGSIFCQTNVTVVPNVVSPFIGYADLDPPDQAPLSCDGTFSLWVWA